MKFKEKLPAIAKNLKWGFIFIVLVIVLWIFLWFLFYPEDYALDLSIEISDLLQLIIIIIALVGPLVHDYITRRSLMPIIEISFKPEKPHVFIANKYGYAPDSNKPNYHLFNAKFYCVTISNSGKSRLQDCEAVLVSILVKQGDEYQLMEDVPQIPLKWVEGKLREETIDINPGREQRLVIFFIPSEVREASPSKINLKINHASDDHGKMERLSFGEYIFTIKVFSGNADIKSFDCLVTFDKGENRRGIWYPECEMVIEEKESIPI
ncbi:MAG: hypothetical protein SVV67_11125 [Bacillota bacterium]|nr:hypothetical protein [Bacillota bacterium]